MGAAVIFVLLQLSSPRVVVLMQLELWDAGDRALNKFDHILPTCQSSTDGTLVFFSYEDRSAIPLNATLLTCHTLHTSHILCPSHAEALKGVACEGHSILGVWHIVREAKAWHVKGVVCEGCGM